MTVVYFLHVLGAAVWVGGLIVMGALVPALRSATEDRAVIRAAAARFGTVTWIAISVQVLTGAWMAADRAWGTTLITKVSLVLVSAALAGWHTFRAKHQSPALRGAIQGVILVLALVIVWLAIQV